MSITYGGRSLNLGKEDQIKAMRHDKNYFLSFPPKKGQLYHQKHERFKSRALQQIAEKLVYLREVIYIIYLNGAKAWKILCYYFTKLHYRDEVNELSAQ